MVADIVGINILGHDQAHIAKRFAQSGVDKFDGLDWNTGSHGAPLVTGASAWLQAQIVDRHSFGTHTVFYCQVLHAQAATREPLLYLHGAFIDGATIPATP